MGTIIKNHLYILLHIKYNRKTETCHLYLLFAFFTYKSSVSDTGTVNPYEVKQLKSMPFDSVFKGR